MNLEVKCLYHLVCGFTFFLGGQRCIMATTDQRSRFHRKIVGGNFRTPIMSSYILDHLSEPLVVNLGTSLEFQILDFSTIFICEMTFSISFLFVHIL